MASRTEGVRAGQRVKAGREPGRRVQLHCFAHAGAGVAGYREWPTSVGAGVDVHALPLPGRDSRRREPRVTDRDALLADLLPTLLSAAHTGPYALYGHSLGALVAYTLTRALANAGAPPPMFLAVGACPPPHAVTALVNAADLPDDRLLPLLDDLGSLPRGVSGSPHGLWGRSVLPVLRDDLRLAAALRRDALDPVVGGPVATPVLVFAGDEDLLAGPATVAHWQRWASRPVERHVLAGDHFFVASPELAGLIGRACRELGDPARDPREVAGRA